MADFDRGWAEVGGVPRVGGHAIRTGLGGENGARGWFFGGGPGFRDFRGRNHENHDFGQMYNTFF